MNLRKLIKSKLKGTELICTSNIYRTHDFNPNSRFAKYVILRKAGIRDAL